MAGVKCNFCNAKKGKRKCLIKNGELICPVCCAKNRNEEQCSECPYFEKSQDFTQKKKAENKPGSIFGSPTMQKAVMETSLALMNQHASDGADYEKDKDLLVKDSYALFSTEDFNDYILSDEDIDEVIKKFGKPSEEEGFFHTPEGQEYFTKATEYIVTEDKFREFSQPLFRKYIQFYQQGKYKEAWVIMSNVNDLMDGNFVQPFTIMMFLRGISRWKTERQ